MGSSEWAAAITHCCLNVQEIVTLLQSLPPGTAGVEQLEKTVAGWAQRWPSVQQPTADACLTVIHVRQLLLDALMQGWPREQQHQGQTIFQVVHRTLYCLACCTHSQTLAVLEL